MKRTIAFLVFTLTVVNTISSQKKLDEIRQLVCQYKHTYMSDTIQRTYRDDLFILQIGKSVSKCYSYYTFQHDSLVSSPEGNAKRLELLNNAIADYRTHRNRRKFLGSFPHISNSTCVYKNYPKGKTTVTDFLGGDHVIYEDILNGQDWNICDSIKRVLNYNCQQAVCTFRGRQWTAWFAPDIPIGNGPWKFGGLPGLIMEVHDRDRQYHFVIIGMEKNERDPILFGESFSKKIKFTKVDRKTFLKAVKHRDDNRSGILSAETGIPIGNDQPVYYDLIERDYK